MNESKELKSQTKAIRRADNFFRTPSLILLRIKKENCFRTQTIGQIRLENEQLCLVTAKNTAPATRF